MPVDPDVARDPGAGAQAVPALLRNDISCVETRLIPFRHWLSPNTPLSAEASTRECTSALEPEPMPGTDHGGKTDIFSLLRGTKNRSRRRPEDLPLSLVTSVCHR